MAEQELVECLQCHPRYYSEGAFANRSVHVLANVFGVVLLFTHEVCNCVTHTQVRWCNLLSRSLQLKVAVNTFVPRSRFLLFVPQNTDCYKHKIKCGRMFASMKWHYLSHLQLLSKAKHSFTAMAKNEVCPRDEIADPPGMAMLPIDRHSFAEGLVSFRMLCGVQSSLMRFAPKRTIVWGPPQWQAPLETLCFSPAFS